MGIWWAAMFFPGLQPSSVLSISNKDRYAPSGKRLQEQEKLEEGMHKSRNTRKSKEDELEVEDDMHQIEEWGLGA
ncbi:hypothetical protein IW261DRAFT_826928 [Armillaria novae-zelandiae]|uniref:Uncharacterized protein n=1 Tax=Armillaria novae-zelandiae TaxID=153914 RepID=A0AA39U0X6_9AGAR|nr:hypothetical protein IW261DRAFT_826928 [Armillaria novae-zelandiae]